MPSPSLPVESERQEERQVTRPPDRPSVKSKSERAQNLVEFALVLPLLLVLVLAAIDFGWALRSYVKATNSVREGARYGALGSSEDTIIQRVVESYGDSSVVGDSNVTVKGEGGQSGNDLEVAVNYNYRWITPLGKVLSVLSGGTLPDPLPISTSAHMRLE